MYYDFDFNRDKEFFNNSKEYSNLLLKITDEYKDANYYNEDLQNIINVSVKLFVESIIKHNLTINSIDVKVYKLIDEKNSFEITNTLGKILNKEKHKRNDKDLLFLSRQSMVESQICLTFYREIERTDIAENLKAEFIEFKSNFLKNKEEKKVKPK